MTTLTLTLSLPARAPEFTPVHQPPGQQNDGQEEAQLIFFENFIRSRVAAVVSKTATAPIERVKLQASYGIMS